jgi:glycerophosphoryl diester phosphodiesterase
MQNLLPRPLIIAHRGCSATHPENTLAAFNAAIAAGAHMVELDVNLSADRRLVVIHDPTVDRTTNGRGAVGALTVAQLTRLDAGSWFDPRFGAERIPTLAQVLECVRGRLKVNIEIKPEAVEAHGPADAVERQVLDLVHSLAMDDAVLISSFAWPVLEKIRHLDARIALGLLCDNPAEPSAIDWCRRIAGFSWHPDSRRLTRAQVDAWHEVGARVFPYQVVSRPALQRLLALGVDGAIVDDPGWFS